MVTIIEIIKAVTETLETAFPNIEVMNKDISKNYPRPCLYIDVDSGSDSTVGALLEQTHGISVFYFAENMEKGFLDLLKVRNSFSAILHEPINVTEDFYVYPDNIVYDISRLDMALKVSFDVQTIQEEEETETELVETLEINIKKE